MLKYFLFIFVIFSTTTSADGVGYGGRHEFATDGWNGSIRHVHNWSNKKNKELFFDFKNHDKFFTTANDFSYVEFIDRRGKVQFHFPSPAYSKLWSYKDTLYVGLSDIKLYNPYQIVVWASKGEIIYKAHLSSKVAKFTTKTLKSFKTMFPEADEYLKENYFIHQGITYCDFTYLGMPNEIGKDAWNFLSKLSTTHPYVQSSESVTNWIWWYDDKKEPEFEGNALEGTGKLTIHLKHGKPLVIELTQRLQQTPGW